jgi:hypothetical protein
MKQVLKVTKSQKNSRLLLVSAPLFIILLIPGLLFSQSDTTKTEVQAAKTEVSFLSPSIQFITVQKNDNTIDLKTALTAKFKGSTTKLPWLKVTYFLVTDTLEKKLGFVITDKVGKAVLTVKSDSLATDKEGKFYFKAVFAGNKQMEASVAEVIIKKARIEITPVKEDSLLTVKVKLIDVGTETPISATALGIFVHRFFNPLKVGEGTTDDNGEATVEIPNSLPGDAKGDITLMAKLDENEIYGNLEASVVQNWGTPVSDKLNELPRALWSEHPPLWMLVTFIVLMVTVWGHYLVIIIQLFRLRKEEPDPNSPTIEKIIS